LVWEVATKSAQLLKELIPAATTIAYLVNPSTARAEIYAKETVTAASALGIRIDVLNASTERDLDEAFASLAKLGAGGLVVPGDPFFDSRREKIVGLAARHAIAAVYTFREYAVAGGLMSYGASLPDSYRRAALYVGRILGVRNRPTCRSCSRPSSILSSTSRPRWRSASTFRRRCSRSPTR